MGLLTRKNIILLPFTFYLFHCPVVFLCVCCAICVCGYVFVCVVAHLCVCVWECWNWNGVEATEIEQGNNIHYIIKDRCVCSCVCPSVRMSVSGLDGLGDPDTQRLRSCWGMGIPGGM